MPHEEPSTTEPRIIRSGDFLTWRRQLASYPASDGWTLRYVLISKLESSKQEITATADGDDHLVEVTSAVTAGYRPGEYRLFGFVEKDGKRHTLLESRTTVEPNPEALEIKDLQSFAEKTLVLVEEALTKLADKGLSSASINGQSYTRQDIDKLRNWRSSLRSEIEAEKLADGRTVDPHIYIHFR